MVIQTVMGNEIEDPSEKAFRGSSDASTVSEAIRLLKAALQCASRLSDILLRLKAGSQYTKRVASRR